MSDRHPTATREDHDRFCQIERWALANADSGQSVPHDRIYELTLRDGRILRTRVLLPIDRSTYDPEMWTHILRNELSVSADQFWDCVENRMPPNRGGADIPRIEHALPLSLAIALRDLGVPEQQILRLDPAAATELHAKLVDGT